MNITKEELIEVVVSILNRDQMIELQERLQEVFNRKSQHVADPIITKKRSVEPDFTMHRDPDVNQRSVPVKAGTNQWTDNGSDEKDGIDAIIVKKATPRVRPPARTKKVICSICRREKEVSVGACGNGTYYRCESCVGG